MARRRLRGLGRRMEAAGIDAALLLHPRDVLYYAGTARPASLLVVRADRRASSSGPSLGDSVPRATLFVRRGMDQARREATVERVEPMRGFSTVAGALGELGIGGGMLGTELDVTPADLVERLREALVGWELADISPLVLEQRLVKDEGEIAATKRAAAAADAGHRRVPEVVAPGMTELTLAAEIERAVRLAGHEGYQPLRHPEARGGGVLLMSGEHLTVRGGHGLVVTGAGLSAATPYGPSRRRIREGDLIVLDTGTTCDGYTADESRTFVVGRATDEQRALFAVAREAEEAVLEAVLPGVPVADVYEAAQSVVEGGAEPFFPLGTLSLPGFVGHGIGSELDEPPVIWPRDESVLREGMVLAIEIEVSALARGMMMKLEDTVVVHSAGCERLTHAPRQLIEVGRS